MLKTAQFTDSFLPIIDGVGRVVFNYANELSLRGYETYVVCPMYDTGYLGGHPFEIVNYVAVKPMKSQRYKIGMPQLDTHYMQRLRMIDFDIIHAHSPGPTGFEALRVAKSRHIPIIGTFHSKFYDDVLEVTDSEAIAALGAKLVSEFYSKCDEVWTVSHNAAETLRAYGYRRDIKIVPNGSDPYQISASDKRAAQKAFGIADAETILLYTGQIDRKKNLELILKSAAILKKREVQFRLFFAGAGPDMERMKKLAESLGLSERFVMTGHITDQHLLLGLYQCASLFMFPSLYDTAGLVVREAASMRAPSVVVRGSAPAEILEDGRTGYLCEDDENSLADVVQSALCDPALLRNVGRRASLEIPLPWNTVITDVLARYEGLIESKAEARKKRMLRRRNGRDYE